MTRTQVASKKQKKCEIKRFWFEQEKSAYAGYNFGTITHFYSVNDYTSII